MKLLKKSQTKYIGKLTDMIRKPISRVERGKLVALITIEVHARDVQDTLVQRKTDSPSAFQWTQQLRFELRFDQSGEKKDEPSDMDGVPLCYVLQTNTISNYEYEYQGNNGRLVVTPMTDRCYMTLTTAMQLKRGGAPQGPAGTGNLNLAEDTSKI
jgi:dynein heavy chain, axonemal